MITEALMERLFPTAGLSPARYNLVKHRRELVDALNKFLPRYEIDNHWRVTAFLACCGIETDYFKTTVEYASGADYEGRKDLGNIYAGDGRKFKGRYLIMTTGRSNYTRVNSKVGKKYGVDLVNHPEGTERNIELAVESACIFWRDHNLNFYADNNKFKELNGIVNRGAPDKQPLHWAKRNELYARCRIRIPRNFSFAPAQPVEVQTVASVTPATQTVQPAPATQAAEPDNRAFNLDALQTDINQASTICAPLNSLKGIVIRYAAKISSFFLGIWGAGIHGKAFLIVGGSACIAVTAYELYKHRARVKAGWERITSRWKR